MMNRREFLDYSDFETMLIAPLAFKREHQTKASLFDRYISYEEIARFIPEFGS